MRADLLTLAGKPDDALELIRKALRLNPQPAGWYYWVQGIALYMAHQYEAACEVLRLGGNLSQCLAPRFGGQPGAVRQTEEAKPGGRTIHGQQPAFHHQPMGFEPTFAR